MFEGFDLADFWEDSEYAREKYIEEPVTPELLHSVEQELGFRLPASYVALMRTQNGGLPKRTCFPTRTRTTWAEDHVAITGIMGIGRSKTYALLGELGSRFMQEEWGYPEFGVCICDSPSGGHDMVMLDYRECGPEGEPAVVHVDQELDYQVTFLAPDFETFVRGFVHESVYDTSAEDLKDALRRIEQGSFSTALTRLLGRASSPVESEKVLRRLLAAIAAEKGCFALHSDPSSYLVYDLLFSLFTAVHTVQTPEAYLEDYPGLLAFGDGEVTTRGYAPAFIDEWMRTRLARGEISHRNGILTLSDAHRERMEARLATFR